MRKRDIAGKIRSTIRKSDKIDYMVSCFERRNEERFRLFAREQSTDTIVLEVPADCKRERKELVYYIRSGNPFSGFGAELRRTLDALFLRIFMGLYPLWSTRMTISIRKGRRSTGSAIPMNTISDNLQEYLFHRPDNPFMCFSERSTENWLGGCSMLHAQILLIIYRRRTFAY